MSGSNSCSVVLLELGVAAFDSAGSVAASKKFESALRSYRLLKSGSTSDEIRQFVEKLRSYDTISVNDASLAIVLRQAGLDTQLMAEEKQQEIQGAKPDYIVKAGFAASATDAMQALRDFAIELSSSRVKEASEKLDLHIVQSINGLDELDKIINTISTRMREWYGLHFPELDNMLQSQVAQAEIIARAGSRDKITREILESSGMQDKKVEIILDAAKRSRGGDMTPENLAIVKKLADQVILQSDLRRVLSDHIEAAMETVAPNVKELLTATVGARILAKAGSLARLAMLPASTIQVLGAEKALFRALKTGARPPKHGILFQHPVIHAAPKWQRGKIARAIASKVAIAARIDYYRHEGKDTAISEKLKTRLDEIREKYKEPVSEKERDQKYREHERREGRRGGGGYGRDRRGGGGGRFGGGGGRRYGGGRDRRGGGERFGGGSRDRRDASFGDRGSSSGGGGGGYGRDRRDDNARDGSSSGSGGYRRDDSARDSGSSGGGYGRDRRESNAGDSSNSGGGGYGGSRDRRGGGGYGRERREGGGGDTGSSSSGGSSSGGPKSEPGRDRKRFGKRRY
ncbi:MAG: NOP5/NOP56 family protein [Nitrososphaera sp.]|uniref:NOP5/NOP56 family protein n=1 Tax=Nitrososphaera sp. TaxID=1971748 RepID=UPI003D6F4959